MKEFRYLRYTLQRNVSQEAHVRNSIRKATAIMGQVWRIDKKSFGGNWRRRILLFDRLVNSIGRWCRGLEVKGKRRDGKRYLRWMLEVDNRTAEYMMKKSYREKN